MRHTTFLLAASLAVFGTFSLRAQEVTAGIYGVVQDSTSAVVPDASITLHNVDTGRDYRTASDPSGNFALTLIPIGNYEVHAQAAGFRKARPDRTAWQE